MKSTESYGFWVFPDCISEISAAPPSCWMSTANAYRLYMGCKDNKFFNLSSESRFSDDGDPWWPMTYFDHSQIRFEMPFSFKLCQYQNFKLFHGLFMFQEKLKWFRGDH